MSEIINQLPQTESTKLIIRRHPIIYLFLGVYVAFIILISVIVIGFSGMIIGLTGEKIFWVALSIFWIISGSIIFIFWTNYELDILQITDKKIIYLNQISFLNREIVEIDFDKIQEIQSKISGILPTIFGYGTLSIKSAANSTPVRFEYIGKPLEIIKQINTIIESQKNSL